MKTLDSVLNLTDIIYPTQEAATKSSLSSTPSMTIRPPTPSMPTVRNTFHNAYTLFEPRQDLVCSQCQSNNATLTNTICKQHYLCSTCLLHSSYQECSLCPPQSIGLNHPFTTHQFPCIKLTNIPWDASQSDIQHFFGNIHMPSNSIYAQCIHILMDRTTGKTLSDAYVELATMEDLRYAVATKNQKTLKGRVVTVTQCNQDELLNVMFPKWRGTFSGMAAIPPDTEVVRSMSTAAGGGGSTCPPFITREEINSLLVVCKNYKLHFSRKCAERPFENIISIITKYPWHQAHLITTMHRDHVYEMLKLAIESLMNHLAKDYLQIESSLLDRMVRAGILCPAFTERQKVVLLQVSRMNCPMDLTWLFMKHDVSPPYDAASFDHVFYHSPLSSRHSSYSQAPPPPPSHYRPQSPSAHLATPSYNSNIKRQHPIQRSSSSPAPQQTPPHDFQHHYHVQHPPYMLMVPPLTQSMSQPTSSSSLGSNYHACQKTSLSPWARSYPPVNDPSTPHSTTATVVKSSLSNSIMTI